MVKDAASRAEEPTIMESLGRPNPATEALHELKRMLGDRQFESQEELQQAINGIMAQKNAVPTMEFLGLSPTHIHSFRHPGMERFQEYVRVSIDKAHPGYIRTPVVMVALDLMLRIADEGAVKATAKGNLPRALVRRVHAEVIKPLFADRTIAPSGEEEVVDLFRIRNALQTGGLLKLRDKKFSLTKKGIECLNAVVKNQSASMLYEKLLFTYLSGFSWLFDTYYAETAAEVQRSVLFDLYILHKKAKNWVNGNRLAEYFIRAFPLAVEQCNEELADKPFLDGEDEIRAAFCHLFLEMFCSYFGFVAVRKAPVSPERSYLDKLEFKTTDLFAATFKWQV